MVARHRAWFFLGWWLGVGVFVVFGVWSRVAAELSMWPCSRPALSGEACHNRAAEATQAGSTIHPRSGSIR